LSIPHSGSIKFFWNQNDQDDRGGLSLGISNKPEGLSSDNLTRYEPGDNGIFLNCWEKGERRVRRFSGLSESLVEEWPVERVEAERKAAYQNRYHTEGNGFRDVWGDKMVHRSGGVYSGFSGHLVSLPQL
jgi:hypothetical protein